MNAIETRHLSQRLGANSVLTDVNLAIPAGSICLLLGPNGAGKSTLIKRLLGLIRSDEGQSFVMGRDSRSLGEEDFRQIGFASEDQELPHDISVGQLLDFCRPLYHGWDPAFEQRMLDGFALPTDRRLRDLSKGMRMKVSLVAALSFRPRLLVLDEPFNGLDPLMRERLLAFILEAASLGDWTVLLASHDIAELEQFVDHVALLENGCLRLSEPLESLQSRFRRIEVDLRGSIALLADAPASWLNIKKEGDRCSFVESAYEQGSSERNCLKRFPNAEVKALPMSLRDVYLTLIDQHSRTQKGLLA
jgi:ABC-2 type transport system ATP-binding protein